MSDPSSPRLRAALLAGALASLAPATAHADHTDVNLLPAAGGTTDIGAGVGEFAAITRLRDGVDPYVWDLSSAGLFTFKGQDGRVIAPYQDLGVKLVVPRLFDAPLRLELRAKYAWESTLEYDGLGNASSDALPPGASGEYRWYGRLHPEIDLHLQVRVADHLALTLGGRYVQNWLQVRADSRLASDARSGSSEVRGVLGSFADHALASFDYGVRWDDRDDEMSPLRGRLLDARLRLSPGTAGSLPYRYAQATVGASVFVALGWRSTLAARVVGDAFFGDPPFYELANYADTYALGGLEGVRGVPAQRYYGKAKVLGNLELRVAIVNFRALGKVLRLEAAGFVDAGRVWAELAPHPELDGGGVGLKYGTGAGLRVRSGRAFLVRADLAWSPDARPLGAYFAAGQAF